MFTLDLSLDIYEVTSNPFFFKLSLGCTSRVTILESKICLSSSSPRLFELSTLELLFEINY